MIDVDMTTQLTTRNWLRLNSSAPWPTPLAAESGPDFAKQERGKRTGQSVSPNVAMSKIVPGGENLPGPGDALDTRETAG